MNFHLFLLHFLQINKLDSTKFFGQVSYAKVQRWKWAIGSGQKRIGGSTQDDMIVTVPPPFPGVVDPCYQSKEIIHLII